MYHETQKHQLCALHALNNLFQDRSAFSKSDLDSICTQLSPDAFINPHRSVLGLGNYDINIITAALQTKNCEVVWFDKRRSVEQLHLSNIKGFILNRPLRFNLGLFSVPFFTNHWITVRAIGDRYYNLDSKLSAPAPVGDDQQLYAFLRSELDKPKVEMMVVISQEVNDEKSWKHGDDDTKNTVSENTTTVPTVAEDNVNRNFENATSENVAKRTNETETCAARDTTSD